MELRLPLPCIFDVEGNKWYLRSMQLCGVPGKWGCVGMALEAADSPATNAARDFSFGLCQAV
jgi:hypothetical protein